jgi:hypothetical protein
VSYAHVIALRDRYLRLFREGRGDGEHAAAAVLLGYQPITRLDRFNHHVGHHGVDWDAVLAEPWSFTEYFLLATATGLFRSRRTEVDISRAGFLDHGQYMVWLVMIVARRTGNPRPVFNLPG